MSRRKNTGRDVKTRFDKAHGDAITKALAQRFGF